jgi:hypothetical protein
MELLETAIELCVKVGDWRIEDDVLIIHLPGGWVHLHMPDRMVEIANYNKPLRVKVEIPLAQPR